MNVVQYTDLGRISYKDAWDYQERLFEEVVQRKVRNRDLGGNEKEPLKHYLLFCEHSHVYTLGKSGSMDHLLINEKVMKEKEIDFFKINRGGDITYHGPGQVVGYPIFDLDAFFTDIHKYMRYLEEVVIRTLAEYEIEADRLKGATGVWLDTDNPAKARKICAMGVRCSRWVTMHGFAFNVNTDLDLFNNIIPCGISDKKVTSLEKELGEKVPLDEVREKLQGHFSDIFDIRIEQFTPQNLKLNEASQ